MTFTADRRRCCLIIAQWFCVTPFTYCFSIHAWQTSAQGCGQLHVLCVQVAAQTGDTHTHTHTRTHIGVIIPGEVQSGTWRGSARPHPLQRCPGRCGGCEHLQQAQMWVAAHCVHPASHHIALRTHPAAAKAKLHCSQHINGGHHHLQQPCFSNRLSAHATAA